MTSELAKTIATSAIWISTAIILAFGLFRMHGNQEFFIGATFVIMACATISTIVIWLSGNRKPRPLPRGFEVIQSAEAIERQ